MDKACKKIRGFVLRNKKHFSTRYFRILYLMVCITEAKNKIDKANYARDSLIAEVKCFIISNIQDTG